MPVLFPDLLLVFISCCSPPRNESQLLKRKRQPPKKLTGLSHGLVAEGQQTDAVTNQVTMQSEMQYDLERTLSPRSAPSALSPCLLLYVPHFISFPLPPSPRSGSANLGLFAPSSHPLRVCRTGGEKQPVMSPRFLCLIGVDKTLSPDLACPSSTSLLQL